MIWVDIALSGSLVSMLMVNADVVNAPGLSYIHVKHTNEVFQVMNAYCPLVSSIIYTSSNFRHLFLWLNTTNSEILEW